MSLHPQRCPWERLPLRCAPCVTEDEDGNIIVNGQSPEDSAAQLDATYNFVEGMLYDKTQRRWPGTCNVCCLRPCPPPCVNLCAACGQNYERLDLFEVLKCFPALEVMSYTINNEVQPLTFALSDELKAPKWRLEDCRYLVLQQPHGCHHCGGGGWPVQDLSKPLGAECTWEICIRYGVDPPQWVLQAVADMVAEQIKACTPGQKCKLDDNVSSVTERGRTYKFRDPSDTNSGVWSWNEVLRCFGKPENWKGPEGIRLPPGVGGSIVKSSGAAMPIMPDPVLPAQVLVTSNGSVQSSAPDSTDQTA
jgi:hypothetical protein